MGAIDLTMPPKVAKQVAEFNQEAYKPPNYVKLLNTCCGIPNLSWADKLAYLAYKLHDPAALELVPVTHSFRGEWYVRTMKIPKEYLFIGRIHILGHKIKLLSGKAILIEEYGKEIREAPDEMTSVPGYQTVAYTLTDVVAETIHPNPLKLHSQRQTDLLESYIFEPVDLVLQRGKEISELLLLENTQ